MLVTARCQKYLAVSVVLVGLLIAYQMGILQRLASPAELKQSLVELGPRGYVAFVVAYALLQPFGAPGTVFVLAAPLIWPWPIAYALSMTGTMAASVIGFSFSRFIARDWVTSKVPPKYAKYNDWLNQRAFLTVALMRAIFWMPQWLHGFLGVSKVSFSTHFWGSLVGYALPLLLVSYFGQQLFDTIKNAPPMVWVTIVGVLLLSVLIWAMTKRKRNAKASQNNV